MYALSVQFCGGSAAIPVKIKLDGAEIAPSVCVRLC